MASIEQLKNRIAKGSAEAKAQHEEVLAWKKQLRAKQDKKYKQRIFEKGKVIEKIQAATNPVNPLPIVNPVPRVTKKDDPAGYAKYQAYIKYRSELLARSEQTMPEDTEKWANSLVHKAQKTADLENLLDAIYNTYILRPDGNLQVNWSSSDYQTVLKWVKQRQQDEMGVDFDQDYYPEDDQPF